MGRQHRLHNHRRMPPRRLSVTEMVQYSCEKWVVQTTQRIVLLQWLYSPVLCLLPCRHRVSIPSPRQPSWPPLSSTLLNLFCSIDNKLLNLGIRLAQFAEDAKALWYQNDSSHFVVTIIFLYFIKSWGSRGGDHS